MSTRSRIQAWVESTVGLHVLRKLPHGVRLSSDVGRLLPHLQIRTVIDVGANKGQSALEFVRFYPGADLHCFEPVRSTFDELQAAVGNLPTVRCHRVALGSHQGSGRMILEGSSDLFWLEETEGTPAQASRPNSEPVQVTRLADFCGQARISHVDLLKIDTEGHDLEVLIGAESLLDEMQIDLVQVEAGMNDDNTRHVSLATFIEYLQPKGYRLFGLYEQVHEWPTHKPHLRRSNAVFVSLRAEGD